MESIDLISSPLLRFGSTFFILVSGLSIFWKFDGSDFVAAYINIPIFVMLYSGWKIWKRTKIIPVADLDFVTGIPSVEETEETGTVEKAHGRKQVRQWM
ncbi:hypothetical protein OF83DRAFT_1175299 [Amylostereum chailletii]|nr:hypothetical protein OF83DRAFT_1175299 [Amylostereum chailletii]